MCAVSYSTLFHIYYDYHEHDVSWLDRLEPAAGRGCACEPGSISGADGTVRSWRETFMAKALAAMSLVPAFCILCAGGGGSATLLEAPDQPRGGWPLGRVPID